MATSTAIERALSIEIAERRQYFIIALAMSATIVAGFAVNLAMGRSSFAVPAAYHAHAVVFMGWVALFITQATTILMRRVDLHNRLGKLAYPWITAMVALGIAIMIVVARRTGGPFFFAVNEFLISNIALLLCFGWLALWSLRSARHSGWHRRLMICAMAMLTGPGIGRLIPMPLLIPYAWTISCALTLIFPAILIVLERRRRRNIHPAWFWGLGLYVGTFIASMMLAFSPLGYAVTKWVVAGSPGAERPMHAFLPPGFTM